MILDDVVASLKNSEVRDKEEVADEEGHEYELQGDAPLVRVIEVLPILHHTH